MPLIFKPKTTYLKLTINLNAPTALPPYAPDAPLPEAIAPPEAPGAPTVALYRREAIDYATIEPGTPAPVYRREPIVYAPIEPWPVDLKVPKYQSPYAPDAPLLDTKMSLGEPATTMSGLGAIDSSSLSTNPLDPSDLPSPTTWIQKLRPAELELAEVEIRFLNYTVTLTADSGSALSSAGD
ncbi:hypothetical protein TorRG33x02_235790 [Trema orientale]|uniref:Uncharacterized protein n=1 Tax=Trema orientale TaxID=63057 RepID=A0A2P5E204_TREOI|nr:hypothetical protein TorRG33x02_235790 [Trema orientale]